MSVKNEVQGLEDLGQLRVWGLKLRVQNSGCRV
jgi:hypothetical protein